MSHAPEEFPVYKVRPRFRLVTPTPAATIASKIKEGLRTPGCECVGEAHPRFTSLKVPEANQHYWSPQLSLTMEETEEEGTIVRGLYGPRPAVWTMFVFFYSAIAFAAVILGIVGLSKMTLGEPNTILWSVPILLFFFLSLYHVAYIGKKKGHEQMEIIHRFLKRSTGLEFNA
jgi:hypothetical protein